MLTEENMVLVRRFLDKDSKIMKMPAKPAVRRMVLEFAAERFSLGIRYTEKQVNAIIDELHSFGDYFLLRRELVDAGFLRRERDGSAYWLDEAHNVQ